MRGSFRVLILYDVSEEINLDRLRELCGAQPARREPSFRHPVPDYVKFERAPVVESQSPITMPSGGPFNLSLKYFDYGVVSVELELSFEAGWDELVTLSSRWIDTPDLEEYTSKLLKERLKQLKPALVEPYDSWLSEDYYVIHVQENSAPAAELLSAHGNQIAQIVRGDVRALAPGEREETLQSSMSYYLNDLLVVGWAAALVYDSQEAAVPTIQLLEYANTQLLEYRHYDGVLTDVLAEVYDKIDRRGGFFRRWTMAREAERLNALRLDIMELTERTDNAIKFLSDMFYARAYRMAAAKVGVPDYRNLVEHKLRMAGDLYEFMVGEFHQSRSFVLEAMVVIMILIELVHLFASR